MCNGVNVAGWATDHGEGRASNFAIPLRETPTTYIPA